MGEADSAGESEPEEDLGKALFAMDRLLTAASAGIDACAVLGRDHRPPLPEDFVKRCAVALDAIWHLRADVWDTFPELASVYASPEGSAKIDLGPVLTQLAHAEGEEKGDILSFLEERLPVPIKSLVAQLDDPDAVKRLRQWWAAQDKPYIPSEALCRGLRHQRRYYRVRTARLIEDRSGADLLNEDGSDVDESKVSAWISSAQHDPDGTP